MGFAAVVANFADIASFTDTAINDHPQPKPSTQPLYDPHCYKDCYL